MAGSGKPYTVLTPFRKQLLRALHEQPSLPSLIESFEITIQHLETELAPLVAFQLIEGTGEMYRPTFFIADAAETARVVAHAEEIGRQLATYLSNHWHELANIAKQLKVSQNWPFADLAFFLVGACILDVDLLDALACDGTFMAPAPLRPGPDTPNARYYFWMIEGHTDQLGRYGQNTISLPHSAWQLHTFGQYCIDGQRNTARDYFEQEATRLGEGLTPEALGHQLNIPVFDWVDVRLWTAQTRLYVNSLMTCYKDNESASRQLYSTLRASSYAPYGFSEFFCWYDHLAYAAAIDQLAAFGLLSLPAQRFTATLWDGASMSQHF